MVFYVETTDLAARNVFVIAISVVPPAGTDIQPHLAGIIFEKEHLTSLMQCLIDCVMFHLDSQLQFYDDPVSEIKNTTSETFSNGEKKHFKERVTASSQKAKAKLGKYFDEECSLHPARKFIYEAQLLNPKTALKFHVRPEFNAISGFSEIPDSEYFEYRLLCREYSSPSGNEFTLEGLRTEAQSIKDFWDGSGANLLSCQKSEELMDFWWGLFYVLNVSLRITTKSRLLTGRPLVRKQLNNLCFCVVIVI